VGADLDRTTTAVARVARSTTSIHWLATGAMDQNQIASSGVGENAHPPRRVENKNARP
jgi:hypothetical protein